MRKKVDLKKVGVCDWNLPESLYSLGVEKLTKK